MSAQGLGYVGRKVEPPIPQLQPITEIMIWTNRTHADPGHQWLRQRLLALVDELTLAPGSAEGHRRHISERRSPTLTLARARRVRRGLPWCGWETGGMPVLEEWWRRVSVTTAVPDASALVVVGLVALAAVVLAWRAVRMLVTVCHEAGHAVAATLSGRSLQGIRLHTDTSGLTVTRGRPTGIGMVVTLFAGYPAASVVGLAAAAVSGAGHAVAMLGLLVVLLALMLLKIRNVHGALVVVGLGAGLGLAAWYAPPQVLVWLAYGLAWLLLLAGPRPVLEVAWRGGRSSPGSDAAQLARLTRVPRLVWIVLWLGATLGALALGTALMLPGVMTG